MSRGSILGVLVGLALLLSAAANAQSAQAQEYSQSKPSNSARVQHVSVRGSGAAIEVEIQTSGAAASPDTQTVTGPDRIIVDFPGALPAAELRALEVNRGALKRIRAGLFFSNPPITRIVLDLAEPQSYRITTTEHSVVVRLGQADLVPVNAGHANPAQVKPLPVAGARPQTQSAPAATLQNAVLARGAATKVAPAKVSDVRVSADPTAKTTTAKASAPPAAIASAPLPPVVSEAPPVPTKPILTVTYVNGMLSIHAEKATLAQVLFEVQRQTQAEIAIPAGAEQEGVVADLGPAPARDVLTALLNGSQYNFIFVGKELTLEQVILTRRQ